MGAIAFLEAEAERNKREQEQRDRAPVILESLRSRLPPEV